MSCCNEYYGCNKNGDYFPELQYRKRYELLQLHVTKAKVQKIELQYRKRYELLQHLMVLTL